MYIVRRTQLYLDDQLWDILHARARNENTTVSELVRQAVRDRYVGNRDERLAAMQNFVGTRKTRAADPNSSEEVRQIRTGSRLDRLGDR